MLRMRASELTDEATSAVDEERRARLMAMAAHYVTLAENENWLVSNSMSVPISRRGTGEP